MYAVCVLLLGFAIFNVNGQPSEEMKKCFRGFHPDSLKCCKVMEKGKHMEVVQECFKAGKKPHEGPPSCENFICVATKLGYSGTEEGTANKTALKQKLQADVGKPELLAAVIKDCVDGDVSKFGPPDTCELFKIKNCIQLHALQACEDWDEEGHCADVKSQIEDCAKILM